MLRAENPHEERKTPSNQGEGIGEYDELRPVLDVIVMCKFKRVRTEFLLCSFVDFCSMPTKVPSAQPVLSFTLSSL